MRAHSVARVLAVIACCQGVALRSPETKSKAAAMRVRIAAAAVAAATAPAPGWRVGIDTPPRVLSRWSAWIPPRSDALRASEVAFAALIAQNSNQLVRDWSAKRLAFESPECDDAHLSSCTHCASQRIALEQAHANATPEDLLPIGHTLTLVDDRALATWHGLARFVRRPSAVFRLRGPALSMDKFDAYCTAWVHRTGAIGNGTIKRELRLQHQETIWRSQPGPNGRAGRDWQPVLHLKHSASVGVDACLSAVPVRVATKAGEGSQGNVGGVRLMASGRVRFCNSVQPRLYSIDTIIENGTEMAHNMKVTPLWFGDNKPAPSEYVSFDDECGKTSHRLGSNRSLLAAAGDTCHSIFRNGARGGQAALTTRRNYCALHPKSGLPLWREVRGLEIRQADETLAQVATDSRSANDVWRTAAASYLDLDGKTDRYRMQVYALAVSEESAATEEEEEAAESEAANAGGIMTPRAPPLLLGALSVLNYPKTYKTPLNESFAPFIAQCAALRGGQPLCDTLDVHLATSRDGIHWDVGWAYARQPLVSRAPRLGDVGSGMILPCGAPLALGGETMLIFAAIPFRHEDRRRFPRRNGTTVPMAAVWPRGAMVGLQAVSAREGGSGHGEVVTKPFALARETHFVSILVEAGGPASRAAGKRRRVQAELTAADGMAQPTMVGRARTLLSSLRPSSTCAMHVAVNWAAAPLAAGSSFGETDSEQNIGEPASISGGKSQSIHVQLRVRLDGSRMYALRQSAIARWSRHVPDCYGNRD